MTFGKVSGAIQWASPLELTQNLKYLITEHTHGFLMEIDRQTSEVHTGESPAESQLGEFCN